MMKAIEVFSSKDEMEPVLADKRPQTTQLLRIVFLTRVSDPARVSDPS
jgi:hypothetical protein